jgi:hypothetical protein
MSIPEIWTASDASALNDFLKTPLGIRWIATLMTLKPKTVIDKGTEIAASTGSYAAGYEYLLNDVIPLTRASRQEEVTARKPIDMTVD